MSNITRRALEAYRAQLVTEFSASITALDAALAHLEPSDLSQPMIGTIDNFQPEAAPVEQTVTHTPVVAEPYLPSPVAPPMPYVNPHIPEASQAPEVAPAQVSALQPQAFADGTYVDVAPEQPALAKTDAPADPWAVTGPHPAAPAAKKGRRTNEEIAAEYGVDLKDVLGTGKNGRITHDDIKAAGEAKALQAAAPARQAAPVAGPPQQFQDGAGSTYTVGPAQQTVQEPGQVQVSPEQFATFQAQQQAGQPQVQQPSPQQFVPPQAQAQQFVPPPALPEGFAPATFQQAY